MFFNRELSWLEFNQRVLEEAKDPDNPMLERLKFLSITASNLDEFFMVRVGGLHMARKAGRRKKDPSGLTPLAQLKEIRRRSKQMFEEMHRCFNEVVSPSLNAGGIRHLPVDELSAGQESFLFVLFSEELFPVISPMAVEPGRPFPVLQNLSLHLVVRLAERKKKGASERYAVMPLNRAGPRIVQLPADEGYAYMLRV